MNKKSLQEKLRFLLLRSLPIQRNTVLFKSFSGQYGDNPKYVSEKLYEVRPDIRQVWVSSGEASNVDFPSYAKVVPYHSWSYDYYASTAQAVVDNMSGIRAFRIKKQSPWRKLFLSRKGQLNLCTWHGTPLKQIGIQEFKDIEAYQTSAKYMTSGNEYCYKVFKDAFSGIPIEAKGTPRNDVFFRDNDIRAIRDRLGLPQDKKLLLYAPTFRDNASRSGLDQLAGTNLDELLNALQKRFGGDWALVIRLHHEVLVQLRESFSGFVDHQRVFDGNSHDDMGDYLAATDALWTDYSSSFFDYLLTDKPCFLMSLDREEYIAKERGLYFDIGELPFPFADTPEEFFNNIVSYDAAAEIVRRREFLEKLGNYEDGHASERFVKEIIDFIG